MRPTARAEALREPLREALEALERAVAPASPFNPAVATHTWRVAATDYAESTIILPALAGLRAAAPGTRLAVVEAAPPRIARQAEQGEIDLGFHTSEGAPEGLRRRALFAERYVLAGRAGHPRLKRRPTLAQFCKLEHVIVSPDGGGFVGVTDEVLAKAGLTRKVALSVPHFLFMLSVLASTDLVGMLPERLVRGASAVRAVEPPVAVPGYEMAMLWHERLHRDPAHQWLRETIAGSV
jgi:DNA-binding transcriptional LysR family regulator